MSNHPNPQSVKNFLAEIGVTHKEGEDVKIGFVLSNKQGQDTLFGLSDEEIDNHRRIVITFYPNRGENGEFDIAKEYSRNRDITFVRNADGTADLHIEDGGIIADVGNVYDLKRTIARLGEQLNTTFVPLILSYSYDSSKGVKGMENLQRWLIDEPRPNKSDKLAELVFDGKQIVIGKKKMKFPLSAKELAKVLGDYEISEADVIVGKHEHAKPSHNIYYTFHEHGLSFRLTTSEVEYLKEMNEYREDEPQVMSMAVFLDTPPEHHEIRGEFAVPRSTCTMEILVREDSETLFPAAALAPYRYLSSGDFINFDTYVDDDEQVYNDKGRFAVTAFMAMFTLPEKKIKDGLYDITPIEDALHFDNLNFKLCILEELYHKNLLTPIFDLLEFAKRYPGKIDTYSHTPLRPVINYFKSLPIPRHLADEITKIDMDGGNMIYTYIIPDWTGEDDYYDLKKVSEQELSQFKNLKKATIMATNRKVFKLFEALGIEVESV